MFKNDRKTIGIFINRAERAEQHQLCRSIIEENSACGFNLIFFSSYEVLEKRGSAEVKETVMVDFAPLDRLDACIIVSETFSARSSGLIISGLKARFKGPVITLKETGQGCYGILSGEDRGAGTLVRHLYSEHNAVRICFFADNSAFRENLRRETFYRDSMEDCGLPVEEEFIFRSDPGTDRGEQAFEYFFNSLGDRPDAVICADDNLAREFTNAVLDHGFQVPKDVMVCGFNDSFESREFIPRITTVADDIREMAHEAMKMVRDLLSGRARGKKVIVPAQMHYRESCGCEVSDFKDIEDFTRNHYHILDSIEDSHVQHSFFSVCIDGCEDFEEIKSAIGENLYLLGDVDEFYLSLLGEREGDLRHFNAEITDTASLELAFKDGRKLITGEMDFDRKELVPECLLDGGQSVYYLSLLHNRDKIFGFTLLNYKDPLSRLNFFHSNWNMTVGLAINECFSELYLKLLIKKNEESSVTDFMTGLPNRRGLDRFIEENWEGWKEASAEITFMTIDLDGLKYINDNFGHKEGDWAISTAARIVRECLKDRGYAARTGGDEFLAVVEGGVEEGEKIRESILSGIENLNRDSEKEYPMAASLGFFSTVIGEDTLYEDCLKRSDDAMYKVKLEHKARVGYRGR